MVFVYVLKIMNIKNIKFKKFHLISIVNEQGWIQYYIIPYLKSSKIFVKVTPARTEQGR